MTAATIERQKVRHVAVQPPAAETLPRTRQQKIDLELDIAITDAQSGVREVIAIIQSRLEALSDGGIACGARNLFQAADIVFEAAIASQDVDDCERASCALHIAQCVLEVVTDKTDDLALWGCVRIAQASKEAMDVIVSDLMRADK
jgi:hypothetical protein